MANFLQRVVNALAGTHFGEQPRPPAPQPIPPPIPPPPPIERRIEIPVQQAPRQPAPVLLPQPRARTLHLNMLVPADSQHEQTRERTLAISMTGAQYRQWLEYQSNGETQKSMVYLLAEVYGVPSLAGASFDEDFDYDSVDFDQWPDADDSYMAQEV